MSQIQFPEFDISREPIDFEYDQAILTLAIAIGIALISIWVVWNNGQSAATSFMLNRDRIVVQGQGYFIKEHGVDRLVYYRFKDKEGELWLRINDRGVGRLLVSAKKIGLEGALFDFLEEQTFVDLKVLVHPKYPRFFAVKSELAGFAFNFRLVFGSLAVFLLSILLGLRSIRKYRKLKTIASYY